VRGQELNLDGYLHLDYQSESGEKKRLWKSESSFEGFAVLRDVLKSIVPKGTDEKDKFAFFMEMALGISLYSPPPSVETDDLVTGWKFISMLEVSERTTGGCL